DPFWITQTEPKWITSVTGDYNPAVLPTGTTLA
ncbi:MAG: hypothetical protein ACI8S6_000776, partial [Myxococcota bacterium]